LYEIIRGFGQSNFSYLILPVLAAIYSDFFASGKPFVCKLNSFAFCPFYLIILGGCPLVSSASAIPENKKEI
jgi:hypothetical protein